MLIRYPTTLAPDISLDNFIKMFHDKSISYMRIQNVVTNTDILNIFRTVTPLALPITSYSNISEIVSPHKKHNQTYEENIVRILGILQLMNLLRYKN